MHKGILREVKKAEDEEMKKKGVGKNVKVEKLEKKASAELEEVFEYGGFKAVWDIFTAADIARIYAEEGFSKKFKKKVLSEGIEIASTFLTRAAGKILVSIIPGGIVAMTLLDILISIYGADKIAMWFLDNTFEKELTTKIYEKNMTIDEMIDLVNLYGEDAALQYLLS